MKGKVSAVCRGSERGKPKVDVLSGFFEKGLGFVGDAHSGTAKDIIINGINRLADFIIGSLTRFEWRRNRSLFLSISDDLRAYIFIPGDN